jgi:hypothetical protein
MNVTRLAAIACAAVMATTGVAVAVTTKGDCMAMPDPSPARSHCLDKAEETCNAMFATAGDAKTTPEQRRLAAEFYQEKCF